MITMECAPYHNFETNNDILFFNDRPEISNCNDPIPVSCRLNGTEGRSEIRPKESALMGKAKRKKRGLGLQGAQKVHRDLFDLKAKEALLIKIDGSPEVGSCDFDKAYSGEQTEEESDVENISTTRGLSIFRENIAIRLPQRSGQTHSALENMMPMSEVLANKSRTEKPSDIYSNLSYNVNKKSTIVPKKSSFPNETKEARLKFGSAKSISSAEYFADQGDASTYRSNLIKFNFSPSISSDDLFGRTSTAPVEPSLQELLATSVEGLSMQDITDSFRKGVSKLAGKIGEVMSEFVQRLPRDFGEF